MAEKMFAAVAIISAILISLGNCVDEIKKLPGVKFDVAFNHYSGYLQVSETHFLHYWFVESQNDPANDPLIFWYNGGPGCSSLLGLLTEMGPYMVNANGKTLHENPNAWNKFASVVYIEAPAGVGFSYSSDGNTTTNDDQTADENYQGIKQFFERHPKFRNHSTFITGESYGGIYIPMLTQRIIAGQDDYKINLAGIAIGNGLLNADLNEDTQLRFMYHHGLIDESKWTEMEQKCCSGCIDSCDFGNLTDECSETAFEMLMDYPGINVYNIYDICDPSSKRNSERFYAYQKGINPRAYNMIYKGVISPDGTPCMDDSQITTYLNLPHVRHALNVKKDLPAWGECGGVEYHKQYFDTVQFFDTIINAKVPIMLYYGDVDMACNFLHAKKFVSQLGIELVKPQVPWWVNKQNAGFITIYKNLLYVTIRGAGHMAPGWKPVQTFYLLKQFVTNQVI